MHKMLISRQVPYQNYTCILANSKQAMGTNALDYAGPFEGSNFLIIVDAFSKWPEIYSTDRTTTAATHYCATYLPEMELPKYW